MSDYLSIRSHKHTGKKTIVQWCHIGPVLLFQENKGKNGPSYLNIAIRDTFLFIYFYHTVVLSNDIHHFCPSWLMAYMQEQVLHTFCPYNIWRRRSTKSQKAFVVQVGGIPLWTWSVISSSVPGWGSAAPTAAPPSATSKWRLARLGPAIICIK